jgi:DNA invertase Pin-like site-specific DNA recombinase
MSAKHSTKRHADDFRRRAVDYWRASTFHQEASIPEQRDWCRAAALKENLDLVRDFFDEGVPGSEIEKRPGLMALIEFCEQEFKRGRPISVVVCWDADRLSRASSIRTAAVLDRLMAAGVTHLLTSEGWFDLEDDCDVLLHNVKQDMGRAAFSRSISKSVTRDALARAGAGRWVGGKAPYGYAVSWVVGDSGEQRADKLVIVEQDAAVIRRLFRDLLAGHSLMQLARALNAEGVRPPGEGRKAKDYVPRWRRDTIRRMLTNRVYVGDLVWNKTHRGKYQRVRAGRQQQTSGQRGQRVHERNAPADLVVIEGAHDEVIDRATFDRAQARLAESRHKRTAPVQNNEWIFSGLLRCGDCAAKMYGRTKTTVSGRYTYRYRRYVCSANGSHGPGACRRNSVSQEGVLAAVLAELQTIYADPTHLAELADSVTATASEASSGAGETLARLDADLTDLDAQIRQAEGNMIHATTAAGVAVFERRLAEMAERRGLLAHSRETLLAEQASASADAEEITGALATLAELGDHLKDVPPREARNVVERLITKATVIFDHSRPATVSHAAYVELEFHPDVEKLLRPDSGTRTPTTSKT